MWKNKNKEMGKMMKKLKHPSQIKVEPAPSWCGQNSLVASAWGGWVQ
jgi:hypothetical protein